MTIYEQLRRDESVRRIVYKDSLGYDTFGVGQLEALVERLYAAGATRIEIENTQVLRVHCDDAARRACERALKQYAPDNLAFDAGALRAAWDE